MTWLSDLSKRLVETLGASAPEVSLGAFGKHPGWADHFELGLEDEPLLLARHHLYGSAIQDVINSGMWDKAPEGSVLAEFKHLFVWSAGPDLLVGRLWAST